MHGGWRNDISRAVSLKLPGTAHFVSEHSVTARPNYGQSQYFWSSVVSQLWCVCVCVRPSGLCLLPFGKQSGVVDYVGSFRVCSVGVMSFGAAGRGMRTASGCSSFKGRSLEPCFFFKTGNRKEAFELKEAFPFTVGSLCCLEETLPRLLHPPWMTTNIHVSPAGSLRKNQEGQTVVNCTGVLLWAWGRLSPILVRPYPCSSKAKLTCSLLIRLTSL